MKMTIQDFLDNSGIEVNKPFMCTPEKEWLFKGKWYSSVELRVNEDYKVFMQNKYCGEVGILIGCEITPMPKYTFTEDEKRILRLKFIGAACVYRKFNNDLFIELDGDEIIILDDNLFSFIKVGVKISLDELRQCL